MTNFSPSPYPLTPSKHHCTVSRVQHFLESIYKWYYTLLPLSDVFHLAWYPQDPSMLLQMPRCLVLSRLNNISLLMYTTSSLSIHPLTDIGYFHIFPIMNNASMNMTVYIILWDPDFTSFRHISRSAIARLPGNSKIGFWYWEMGHCCDKYLKTWKQLLNGVMGKGWKGFEVHARTMDI